MVGKKEHLSDLEVNRFIRVINELCGMDLSDKRNTLLLRLPKFLEKLEIKRMGDLLKKIETDKSIRQKTLDFITINETYFLRESSRLQEIISHVRNLGRKANILSAPCASGEEVYSLAILAAQSHVKELEILGVDINSKAIEEACSGTYYGRTLHKLTQIEKEKFFIENERGFTINKNNLCPCKFELCNILEDDFLKSKKFDVILSRNVLIYFDNNSKLKAMKNFHGALVNGGRLYVGSADLVPENGFFKRVFSSNGNYYEKV